VFRSRLYIQVESGQLLARRLGASGVNAGIQLESAALGHPRTLMGNFQAVEALFRQALARLKGGWLAPRVLLHLMPDAAGGYTDVEQRAFIEAARGAGAVAVRLQLAGPALTDAQARQALDA
jgi:hypothetical protein